MIANRSLQLHQYTPGAIEHACFWMSANLSGVQLLLHCGYMVVVGSHLASLSFTTARSQAAETTAVMPAK